MFRLRMQEHLQILTQMKVLLMLIWIIEQKHCLIQQNHYLICYVNRCFTKKIMKMSVNEANGPEFILELEDDDEVLFDHANDWNYRLQAEILILHIVLW